MKNFDDQKRLALENQSLESEKERDNHFKAHGVGWHAFLRLPYFNPIRMAVLDPMHNLLLGESCPVAFFRFSNPRFLL